MATSLPQRPEQHQLSDESVRFFGNHLPRGWVIDEPKKDYGVDLRVSLADDGYVTGQTLSVQLKASTEAPHGKFVTVDLAVSTLNYLRNLLDVVLLVKYVAAEQEAYWLLLKDFVAQPADGQQQISIRVPRVNRLTQDPWAQIADHVAAVHAKKLAANTKAV